MIQINISGPRGSGKTTLAIAIGKMLQDFCQEVEYVGATRSTEEQIKEELRVRTISAGCEFSDSRKFQIVDVCLQDYP